MNDKLAHFEKYSVAPSPSRDYYAIKIYNDKVILYVWKISHGPHLSPVIRIRKNAEFNNDKTLKDEIQYIFGSRVLKYIELVTTQGTNTLLTLPKYIIRKLIKYLSIEDIAHLLRVCQISNEIFNDNSVWEILFKRLKRSSRLSEMEKELSESQGFKKLAKDYHVRNFSKMPFKSTIENSSRPEKFTPDWSGISRSASANISKIMLQNDPKNATKNQSIDGIMKKLPKPLKSPVRLNKTRNYKNFELPKKSTSEGKSLLSIPSQKFLEKHAAGESYRNPKLINTLTSKSNKIEKKSVNSKFPFVNNDEETSELHLQKKLLKSALMQPDFCDVNDMLDKVAEKVTSNASPKTISSTKNQNPSLAEIRSKPTEKIAEAKKHKVLRKKISSTTNSNMKKIAVKEYNTDSDESGMTYLMKRYLEASNEVARKYSEIERSALASGNLSTPAEARKISERRPLRKPQKSISPLERPVTRGEKVKSLKKK